MEDWRQGTALNHNQSHHQTFGKLDANLLWEQQKLSVVPSLQPHYDKASAALKPQFMSNPTSLQAEFPLILTSMIKRKQLPNYAPL